MIQLPVRACFLKTSTCGILLWLGRGFDGELAPHNRNTPQPFESVKPRCDAWQVLIGLIAKENQLALRISLNQSEKIPDCFIAALD
jgi:hypothetical protein